MKRNLMYRIFLFLSTFTRGLVDVFSLVLLYQKGFTFREISWFLFLMYFIGIFVNYVSLKFSYKKILLVSSILYGISFLYLSNMNNTFFSLIILAILLSCSTYSYHAIRHFIGIRMVQEKGNSTTLIITLMYLGIIVSSLVGSYVLSKLSIVITGIIVFVLSILSIVPVIKMGDINCLDSNLNYENLKIPKRKILFNIFEQFKVIFLELQPLFLYLYIDKSIYYVGIFNVVVNIASLIVVYFLSKKIKLRYFKYICLLLGGVFLLKLNIKSGMFLLLIAFFEGILVKIYETVSLNNLYSLNGNSVLDYLMMEEFIFFGSKSLVMLVVGILGIKINIIMYFCIIGITISGFVLKVIKD